MFAKKSATKSPIDSAILPAGADDESSRFYVPPELRPVWAESTPTVAQTAAQLQAVHDAESERFEYERQRAEWLADPNANPLNTDWHPGFTRGSDGDGFVFDGRRFTAATYPLPAEIESMLDDLAAHSAHLTNATGAARRVSQADANQLRDLDRHTCPICQNYPVDLIRVKYLAPGAVYKSDEISFEACGPCSEAIIYERGRLAAETPSKRDGRTRGEIAVEILTLQNKSRSW